MAAVQKKEIELQGKEALLEEMENKFALTFDMHQYIKDSVGAQTQKELREENEEMRKTIEDMKNELMDKGKNIYILETQLGQRKTSYVLG